MRKLFNFPRHFRGFATSLALATVVTLGAGPGISDDHPRAIRHSDVVFMYDNPEMYQAYGCTVLGWAGAQSGERIRLAHQRGVRLFAVSIGFRTEFARMIDFSPNFLEAACRNFAGETFIVPWLWDHKHKGQPAWWFCTNSPLYRDYLYSRLREVIAVGADALHIDDYTGTAGAVTWLDACFCPACMAGFRAYLQKNLPEEKKRELKIDDLSTFNYREYLLAQGVTPESYRSQRSRLPLASEFLDFHVKAATDFVAEFRRRASEWKGSHMPLAVNSNLIGPMNLAITPYLDYFCCEVDHHAAKRQVPLHPIYVYKLADGLNRPVTSTASGWDWADVAANNLPGLVRTWVALSYAFGHNFMAPHRQWCYTKEKGTHWYNGPTEAYAPIYQFVRAQAARLDDFQPVARVAVIYDNQSQRQGRGNIEPICTALAENNIPFAVLVEGDDWLPGYQIASQMIEAYAAILVPEDLRPASRLESLLQKADSQGKLIRWKSREVLTPLANRWVQVQPPEKLLVSVRRRADSKGLAIHVVNRQYDATRDGMTPCDQVQLRLNAELLLGPATAVRKAVAYAYGEQPRDVTITSVENSLQIDLGKVDLWTIVELVWE